jgi:hypothetical protein
VIDIVEQLVKPTAAYVNAKIQSYAATAELLTDAWQVGDVGQQIMQAVSFTIEAFTGIITGLTRSGFGETAEDPGDDPSDPDPDYTAPKWLSYHGEGMHGTVRKSKTFATGSVTLTNAADGQTRILTPYQQTFTRSTVASDGTYPTYRNAVDASIYIEAGGTKSLAPGGSITIPIVADVVGTGSNAAPNEITIITTTMIGVTVTNDASVTGSDGETAAAYRLRFGKRSAITSPGGASKSYEYLATTQPGGDPLLNASGNPVNIPRTYVSPSSALNKADAYYASDTGAASAEDVIAANLNIITYGVPSTVTFGPSTSPVGGIAAVEVPIAITYTAKIKDFAGIDTDTIKADIAIALDELMNSSDIGGFDSVLGAGVIYTVDIGGEIKGARRDGNTGAKWGLYDVIVTTPAGATTAIILGRVATLGTITATLTVVP